MSPTLMFAAIAILLIALSASAGYLFRMIVDRKKNSQSKNSLEAATLSLAHAVSRNLHLEHTVSQLAKDYDDLCVETKKLHERIRVAEKRKTVSHKEHKKRTKKRTPRTPLSASKRARKKHWRLL